MVMQVTSTGVNFKQLNADKAEMKKVSNPQVNDGVKLEKQPTEDTFVKENNNAECAEGCCNGDCANIGVIRLATGFLTDAQVEEINKTGKLPENAKFIPNGVGQYIIANNFFNLRAGTQTMPEGFEVKKNFIGQAIVVPKGTQGLLIK